MFPHMSVEKRFLSREAGFPLDLLDIWGGAWALWEDPTLIDYIIN